MTVSVIVGTFHREAPLRRALESLKAQTFQDMEILVADDNADDSWNLRVRRIADEFGARHIVNEKNLGSAMNRNHAVSLAKGEYIAFLDDDDVYLPHKLAHQLAAIQKANTDICIENFRLVDENGVTIETRTHEYLQDADPSDYMRLNLLHHMTGPDSIMFRKDAFERIGGFPPIDLGDDIYLMIRAIENKLSICWHPEVGALGTVHPDGGLSGGLNKIKCEDGVYAYIQKYLPDLPAKDRRYVRMRHYAVKAYAYLRMKRMGAFFRQAFLSFIHAPVACVKLFLQKRSERGVDA